MLVAELGPGADANGTGVKHSLFAAPRGSQGWLLPRRSLVGNSPDQDKPRPGAR